MKQYTDNKQTAKLIELGFEKPSNTIVKEEPIYREGSIIDWKPIAEEGAYSIGELIEMLPSALSPNNDEDREFHLMLFDDSLYWHVRYTDGDNFCYSSLAIELIDALYDMVIKLKEEGVI